jgi:hypothetical protein
MKVVKLELFNQSEKALISEFVGSEFWPLYKKMLTRRMENLAKLNLGAATWEESLMNRGCAAQIEWELNQFRKINKEFQQKRAERKIKAKKKE